jgi:hypothetical protein
MGETLHTKKHADFQDRFRRSSNFRSVVKQERFKISGDGKVILNEDFTEKE